MAHDGKKEDAGTSDYTGLLAEPMTTDMGLDDYLKRIDALFDHFKVEKDNWQMLAIALAHAHVDGFQYKQIEFPKIGRSAPRDLILFVEMVKRIENRHSTKRAAELVVAARPDLGFESTEAARQRFMQLTSSKDQGRNRARAHMLMAACILSPEVATLLLNNDPTKL